MRIVLAFIALTALAPSLTEQVADVSSDCRAVRLLRRLATIDVENGRNILEVIDKQEHASCAARASSPTILWRTGERAKYADGTWDFPNGVRAIFLEGRLQYPKGLPAKYADGTWAYPNGVTARFQEGTWSRPNGSNAGTISNLVAWACSVVPSETCRLKKAVIDSAQDDEKNLSVIELAWLARDKNDSVSWTSPASR